MDNRPLLKAILDAAKAVGTIGSAQWAGVGPLDISFLDGVRLVVGVVGVAGILVVAWLVWTDPARKAQLFPSVPPPVRGTLDPSLLVEVDPRDRPVHQTTTLRSHAPSWADSALGAATPSRPPPRALLGIEEARRKDVEAKTGTAQDRLALIEQWKGALQKPMKILAGEGLNAMSGTVSFRDDPAYRAMREFLSEETRNTVERRYTTLALPVDPPWTEIRRLVARDLDELSVYWGQP